MFPQITAEQQDYVVERLLAAVAGSRGVNASMAGVVERAEVREGRAPQALAASRASVAGSSPASLLADVARRPAATSSRSSSSAGSTTPSCSFCPSASTGACPSASPPSSSPSSGSASTSSRSTSRGRCTCWSLAQGRADRPGHHRLRRLRLQVAHRQRLAAHHLRRLRRSSSCSTPSCASRCSTGSTRRDVRARRGGTVVIGGGADTLAHRQPLPRAARLRAGARRSSRWTSAATATTPSRRCCARWRRAEPAPRQVFLDAPSLGHKADLRPHRRGARARRRGLRHRAALRQPAGHHAPAHAALRDARDARAPRSRTPASAHRRAPSAPSTSSPRRPRWSLLAPVFAVIAVLIKRDSPGPVFYRQTRVGPARPHLRVPQVPLDDGRQRRRAGTARPARASSTAARPRTCCAWTSGAAPSTRSPTTSASRASAASCASTRSTSCRSSGTCSRAT